MCVILVRSGEGGRRKFSEEEQREFQSEVGARKIDRKKKNEEEKRKGKTGVHVDKVISLEIHILGSGRVSRGRRERRRGAIHEQKIQDPELQATSGDV